MVVVSVLLAPAVMAAAAMIERRLGPSAAGWVAALPIALSVAIVAVALDAGTGSATALALSAATHVPAQVAFGVAFASVLVRRGLVLGAAAGALAYLACAALIPHAPDVLAVTLAVVVLAVVPRLMPGGRPRPGSPRRRVSTALSCTAAAIIVGVAVVTCRLAGPQVAGAVAAFPTISMTLAVTVVRRDGPVAGAHALLGLVRSLPCYLTFCLVVALAAPAAGLVGIPLGLLACLAAAPATWRAVPLAHPPALALDRRASVTTAQVSQDPK